MGRKSLHSCIDNPIHKQEFIKTLEETLPPFIARTAVEDKLGGIVSRKSLANADARGTGPEIAYSVGRKVVYTRESLLKWLAGNFAIQKLSSLE